MRARLGRPDFTRRPAAGFGARYPRRSGSEQITPEDWRARATVVDVSVRRAGFRS